MCGGRWKLKVFLLASGLQERVPIHKVVSFRPSKALIQNKLIGSGGHSEFGHLKGHSLKYPRGVDSLPAEQPWKQITVRCKKIVKFCSSKLPALSISSSKIALFVWRLARVWIVIQELAIIAWLPFYYKLEFKWNCSNHWNNFMIVFSLIKHIVHEQFCSKSVTWKWNWSWN